MFESTEVEGPGIEKGGGDHTGCWRERGMSSRKRGCSSPVHISPWLTFSKSSHFSCDFFFFKENIQN